MRDYHEDKYYTKPLKNFVYERYKMGLFGDKTENIVISQAAAGGNTNSVNVKVPIWEIILISSAIAAIVFLCCSCLVKKLNYFCENEIKKTGTHCTVRKRRLNPFIKEKKSPKTQKPITT
jgi:hypothetical protein